MIRQVGSGCEYLFPTIFDFYPNAMQFVAAVRFAKTPQTQDEKEIFTENNRNFAARKF